MNNFNSLFPANWSILLLGQASFKDGSPDHEQADHHDYDRI